jgi:glycosyltransferase involved in cell wall biosynthesis
MVAKQPDLTVIIPMHNAGGTIAGLVESFVSVEDLDIKVIVVDDGSTDNSVVQVDSVGGSSVTLERSGVNRGAGVARNRGFELATGRYCLFFDADDEIHPATLASAVRSLDDTGASVAMMTYRYRRGLTPGFEEMNSFDAAVWGRYATTPRRVVRLGDVPRLLGFSNYPWNKIVRTDHFQRTGLRFGSTPVHNDILGHWLTLLDAENIVLLDQPLCTHIVNEGGRNLTNREGRARLSLVDALDETYTAIEARPDKRNRFSHHYWDFALRVATWARDRMTPEVREEFDLRLQQHLLRMDLLDFARIRSRRDPGLATRIVRSALA